MIDGLYKAQRGLALELVDVYKEYLRLWWALRWQRYTRSLLNIITIMAADVTFHFARFDIHIFQISVNYGVCMKLFSVTEMELRIGQ